MMNEYTYDVSMFRDTFETRFTYLNGFLRNVSRFGARPALHDPLSGRRWTYRELNAAANRLAHALRADGVGKNDVVMFALLNSPEFVFCYLAAHKIGAIACPVNYRQGAGEIALVIDDSRPKAFLYDADGRLPGRRAGARRSCLLSGLCVRPAGDRPAGRFRPPYLRRNHPPVYLGYDQPAQGRADQQCQRGAFRA